MYHGCICATNRASAYKGNKDESQEKVVNKDSTTDFKEYVHSDEDVSELKGRIRRLEIEVFRKVLETKGIMISKLQDGISELKPRVNMDSSNSSKPPSTDMFKKPRVWSLRRRSELRPGGQPSLRGHHIL